jgi:hypothetical protein
VLGTLLKKIKKENVQMTVSVMDSEPATYMTIAKELQDYPKTKIINSMKDNMETDAMDKMLTIIAMVEELAQIMAGAKELQDDLS